MRPSSEALLNCKQRLEFLFFLIFGTIRGYFIWIGFSLLDLIGFDCYVGYPCAVVWLCSHKVLCLGAFSGRGRLLCSIFIRMFLWFETGGFTGSGGGACLLLLDPVCGVL